MYAKTRSHMTADQLAVHDERLAQDMPIGGKLGDAAHDLAPVIRFLISEDARFITGQTIAVDGGLMMVR
jgi:NAD(P)-dependent dehydrogenase (short-subunit alcohol dehydrogenase family)